MDASGSTDEINDDNSIPNQSYIIRHKTSDETAIGKDSAIHEWLLSYVATESLIQSR